MAVPTSFKQQCPSCEAMVPIRDPKLVGRKIDCPKCKYRFIVEEPAEEADEVEEEAPAKKGKGATAITNKKSANGKAAKAPAKRRADDDQDVEETKPKKKQGGSGMLIVGIALAAVAVVALAVGAVFLFKGDDSDDKPNASRPSGNANAPSNSGEQEKPKDAPKPEGPRPRQEDITNLLPNDAQVVLNLPMEHLLGNNKVNQALLNTPGSFHVGTFQSIWGIAPSDVRRVVLAASVEKKYVFSVMRTKVQLKEKQIVETLQLKAEEPINGLKYYLVKKPLDALSTFLLKGALAHDKVALRFMDRFTVICADVGSMNQFLQEKEQPKQLSKREGEGEQKDGGEQGGPAGGTQGGPPGGMQGGGPAGRMRGGKAGGPMRPGGGPPGGQPGGSPGGPGRGPGGPGGFRPPSGMAGGMAPPGMTGEGGGGPNEAAPVSSSYMTIDPQLKAVLDQVEKVDKTENQNVLLSFAFSTSLVSPEHLKELMAQAQAQQGSKIPQVPDVALKVVLDTVKSKLKAVGVAVTDFNESRVIGNAAVAAQNATLAQDWEKQANEDIPKLLTLAGLDFVARNANRSNTPSMGGMQGGNMPNMPGGGMRGMMGGGMRGMMGGGPMGPGGGMRGGPMGPGGGMRGGPMGPGGGMRGGPMGPGGGMRGGPMGPGGMQPPGGPNGPQPPGSGDDQPEEATGKLGNYGLWTKDNILALGVTYIMSQDKYNAAGLVLELKSIYFRSIAAMSDRRSHIHELAAAMQAYLEDKGRFPRGAKTRPFDANRFLEWRPDQRISWMAEVLPYLANGEFKDIKPDYGKDNKTWYEDPNNIKAGMAVIPQFVASPAKPDNELYFYVSYPNLPVKSSPMWAATHFVGIAGVGLDAAEYRADDPATAKLLGVFGYDRETKKADIKDGLDQTIVLIQVPPEPKSPWIAGGGSTVRGVSQDLDCVKPFVSTEYQGKRGAFAIMADGKVRFIPASIDPKTFQAMCTIAGGDKIRDLDKVAPEVPPPEDQPQAELKAEQPAQPAAKKPTQRPPAVPKAPAPEKPVQPPAPAAPKQPAVPPSK
jgi:DNA-directed RNA polymerase subunit M/transcription elongation factor TFIIS